MIRTILPEDQRNLFQKRKNRLGRRFRWYSELALFVPGNSFEQGSGYLIQFSV